MFPKEGECFTTPFSEKHPGNNTLTVFPPENNKGGGVTMNVLMFNYQYCFNT